MEQQKEKVENFRMNGKELMTNTTAIKNLNGGRSFAQLEDDDGD